MAQARKLLITGASGFIGQHVTRLALQSGHTVLGVDLLPPPASTFAAHYTSLVKNVADLTANDLTGVTDAIHLAATVSVPLCEENPVLSTQNNFNLLMGLLEILSPTVPLVFASSAAVYGDASEHVDRVKESDVATWPLSFYAAQKRACEMFLQIACRNHGRRATALRFFNVYGQGQDPSSPYSGVLSRFIALAKKGEILIILGDGRQTRDFVAVQDVAHAVLAALDALHRPSTPEFSVYNVGTGEKTMIGALPEIIGAILGRKLAVAHAPSRSGDIRNSCADTQQLGTGLGLKLETRLAQGLRSLLQSGGSA